MKSFTYPQTYLYQALAIMACLAVLFCVSFTQAQQAERPPFWHNAQSIYVSPDGDDANTGVSEDKAVQTVERGISLLRNGQPDWLLLERGHNYTITQVVNQPAGTAPAMPMVIHAYGDLEDATPQLNVGPNSDKFNQAQQFASHIQIGEVTLTGLDNPFPILEPGNGWTGPTPQPDAVGTPGMPGYDAKAIARWDVVPYQTFDEKFHIGVVAFHMNGINRVEFSVNGGNWKPVYEMNLNPRTGVWEFVATLDASKFNDGLVEVRARIYPRGAGEVRVLGGEVDGHHEGSIHFRNGIYSMFLNANSGSSLLIHEVYADARNGSDSDGDGSPGNPFRSASRALAQITADHGSSDGAVCYLMPGEYVWEGVSHPHKVSTRERWATITSAPGTDREQVIFVNNEPAGMRTRLLRGHNITLNGGGGPRTVTSKDTYFWLSNSAIAGSSRFEGGGIASGSGSWAGIYGTDLVASEIKSPFRSSTFVRNVRATGFSDTPFGSDTMVLNADVRDFTRNPSGTHADIFHWFWQDDMDRENRIIYGLRVHKFPLLGFLMNPISGGEQSIENVAIVNVHISKDESSVAASAWGLDVNHLVISGLQLPDQTFRFNTHRHDTDGALTITNLSVTNSIFRKITGTSLPEDGTFRNLHILDSQSFKAWVPIGVDITDGHTHGGETCEEIFVSPSGLNYHPLPFSIIWNRFPASDLFAPSDVIGRPAPNGMVPLGAYFGSAGPRD